MNKYTDFLVAKNSFLIGVARVVDLGSTRNNHVYNTSETDVVADEKALLNDWTMVGKDIWSAYEAVRQEATY